MVKHFEDLKSELPSWVSFPDPDEPAPAEAEGAESEGYSSVILVGCTVYMRTDIKSTDGLEGYAAAVSVATSDL